MHDKSYILSLKKCLLTLFYFFFYSIRIFSISIQLFGDQFHFLPAHHMHPSP